MKYEEAKSICHVRSAIFREADPDIRYWKNYRIPLDERVPDEDKPNNDWEEYDPRDDDDCSLFMFND